MKLVVIRHATPESEGYADEKLRPLSVEGKKQILTLSEELQTKGLYPKAIFCSPILRAVQTAELLQKKMSGELKVIEALGYNFDSIIIEKLIRKYPPDAVVFAVGHEPSLSQWISQLNGDPICPLHKAEAVIIDL